MMYNLSVHQQLGKVSHRGSKCTACGTVCLGAWVCVCMCPHMCPGSAGHLGMAVPQQDWFLPVLLQPTLADLGGGGGPGPQVGSLPGLGSRRGLEKPGCTAQGSPQTWGVQCCRWWVCPTMSASTRWL